MSAILIIGIVICLIVVKIIYENTAVRKLKTKEIIEWERRGEYIDCFGYKIFCVMSGEFQSADKTLVLLHGYPESSFIYKDCIEEFRKHFTCIIAMDYLGFGLSEKPTQKRKD